MSGLLGVISPSCCHCSKHIQEQEQGQTAELFSQAHSKASPSQISPLEAVTRDAVGINWTMNEKVLTSASFKVLWTQTETHRRSLLCFQVPICWLMYSLLVKASSYSLWENSSRSCFAQVSRTRVPGSVVCVPGATLADDYWWVSIKPGPLGQSWDILWPLIHIPGSPWSLGLRPCLKSHAGLASFLSCLSPLLVPPGSTSFIIYLHTNLVSQSASRETDWSHKCNMIQWWNSSWQFDDYKSIYLTEHLLRFCSVLFIWNMHYLI